MRVSKWLVGVLLICAAIALPVWRAMWLASVPLNVPLPLQSGGTLSSEFTTDRDGVFQVVVMVDLPPIGDERFRIECLMGWDWGNPKWGASFSAGVPPCRESPLLNLRWTLTSLDGHRPVNPFGESVEAGTLSGMPDGGAFGRDEAARSIAAFGTLRGWRYRLELQTLADARALASARPRIVVQPTGATVENRLVATVGHWLTALVSGGVGLVVLALAWLERHDKHLRSPLLASGDEPIDS